MRVRTLDSLRGLAALMVVLYHWNLAFPAPNWKSGLVMHADFWLHGASWLRLIFRLAFLGPAAVLVFFVLSGFVLALSLRRPEETYGRFVIKRIFRIYPPYVFAVLLATALYFLAMPHSIPQLSDWFNNAGWTVRPTWSLVFGHLAMLGTQRFQSLDPPIWSLVHEMRISLLFPIIAYCVSRSWKTSLALSLMASMAGMALTPKVPELAASWLQTV